MSIKDRIQQFIDAKGIKTARFEKEVGLSNGYWRKTASISANCVEDILKTYPELSAEWVFRGTGNMLCDNGEPQPNSIGLAYYEQLAKDLADMKQRMSDLENKVG